MTEMGIVLTYVKTSPFFILLETVFDYKIDYEYVVPLGYNLKVQFTVKKFPCSKTLLLDTFLQDAGFYTPKHYFQKLFFRAKVSI